MQNTVKCYAKHIEIKSTSPMLILHSHCLDVRANVTLQIINNTYEYGARDWYHLMLIIRWRCRLCLFCNATYTPFHHFNGIDFCKSNSSLCLSDSMICTKRPNNAEINIFCFLFFFSFSVTSSGWYAYICNKSFVALHYA